MHLSTSNSRAPKESWRRTWIFALVLLLFIGGSGEYFLRIHGFRPSLQDDINLWTLHRARAGGSEALVLIGASRMQVDVDPEVLTGILGRPVVQLAMAGTNPIPVLADLSDDESFRGDVWVSMRAQNLLESWGESGDYVIHARRNGGNLNTRLNTLAVGLIDGHLALRNSNTNLKNLIVSLLKWTPPAPPFEVTMPNRFRPTDFTLLDIGPYRETRLSRSDSNLEKWRRQPPSMATFLDSVGVLERRIQKIQARGGNVVLIRFPTGPEHWSISERVFPREMYWYRLASLVSATVLHFKDYERLSSFYLPDESHLDFRDTSTFTKALVRTIDLND